MQEGLAWQRAEIWGVTEVAGQAVDVLGEGAWQYGWVARVASKTARWRLWEVVVLVIYVQQRPFCWRIVYK